MIKLTRLNNEEIVINAYQVESVEQGADTCVTLMNGKRLFIQESTEDVEAQMMAWFRKIHGVNDGETS